MPPDVVAIYSPGLEPEPVDPVGSPVPGRCLYRHFPERRHLISAVPVRNLQRNEVALAEASANQCAWAGLTGYLTWLC